MGQRASNIYLRFLVRCWPLVLIISLILAVPAVQGTLKMFRNINTDLAHLLPDSHPNIYLINQVRNKLEGSGNLRVFLEGDNREAVHSVLDGVVELLQKNEQVQQVEYKKVGYDFFDKHKLLFLSLNDLTDIRESLDRRIQREKLGDFFISLEDDEPQSFDQLLDKYKSEYSTGVQSPYYESDDGKVFFINIIPKGSSSDFTYAENFYENVFSQLKEHAPLRQHNIQFYLGGSIRSRVDEYRSLMSDLSRAGLIAAIGILLVLILAFKSIYAIFLILAPLSLGIIYTFGITSLFIDGFNTVTAFMFSIMAGLGIDFGIHMVSRYREERSQGHGIDESLIAMQHHVGRASLTSAMTTATAFLLLTMVDFKVFSEFGFIAGLGILASIGSYWLLLPAWIRFLESVMPMKVRTHVPNSISVHFKKIPTRILARIVLYGAAGMTLLSIAVIPHIGFEYDYAKLRSDSENAQKTRAVEDRVRQRRPNPAVVFLDSKVEHDAIVEAIDDLKTREGSLLDNFYSIYSLVPDQQRSKIKIINDIDILLNDKLIQKVIKDKDRKDIDEFRRSLKVTPFSLDDVPVEAKAKFIGETSIPGTAGFIILKEGVELQDGRNAIQLASEIEHISTAVGTFDAINDAIIFGNVLTLMLQKSRLAIPLAFIGVLIFLLIDLKSLKKSIFVVTPWLAAILWMASSTVVLDLQLNFYNIFMPAAVFGMGIDYSVHFLHRYWESNGQLKLTLFSAGRAIAVAGLTTMVGFAGLAFANHKGLQSMGKLALIGIGLCMIASLTLLPAILQVYKGQWRR
jgi:uncharacterized protein